MSPERKVGNVKAFLYNGTVITVSIIIVHYNTKKETDACVRSLRSALPAEYSCSVTVVDNGSREEYSLPKDTPDTFTVIRSEANLGFTGGNNLGIYTAIENENSDFVLLLNSDTLVDSQFLSQLLQHALSHPKVGLLCPKIYFAKGSEYHRAYERKHLGKVLWYAGGSIDWQHLAAFHRGVDELDRGQFDSQQQSDFATGCCVLIRREVLEKVGAFDKHYFLYMEDVDLSVRAYKAGYSIGFCPSAVVWHKNAGSSGGSGSKLHAYYQTRNRLYFAFKHGNWQDKLVATRIALQKMVSGSSGEQLGVLHLLTGKLGKQPLI